MELAKAQGTCLPVGPRQWPLSEKFIVLLSLGKANGHSLGSVNRSQGRRSSALHARAASRARARASCSLSSIANIRRHLRRRLEHFSARLPCPGPIPGHPVPSEARRARGRGAGPVGALASWCAHGCIMVDLLCLLLPGPVPNRPKPPRKLRLRGARVTAWRRRRKGVAVMNSKQ